MPIKSPHDLFLHDLGCAYYSEHTILKGMHEMAGKAHSDRVKQMLNEHIKESEQQVKNLEQCFTELGGKARQVKSFAADGLVEDFKTVANDIQDGALIDLSILGTMDKVEHFETAEYRGLVNKAKLMGHTKVAQILSQVGSGEEREAKLVESAEQELGRQIIGKLPPSGPTVGPRTGH